MNFLEKKRIKSKPNAAEMLVELWPVPKASYSLSARLVKPASPFVCLIVGIWSRLPVKILCGYDCNFHPYHSSLKL